MLRIDATFFGQQMLVSEIIVVVIDQSWDGLKQPPGLRLAKGPPQLELALSVESDRCCI